MQFPLTQFLPGPQTMPQPPQLLLFVCVFVSQPLENVPSQLAKPELQVKLHWPVAGLQTPFAFAAVQTTGVPPLHTPAPLQTSPCVHGLPSLHAVPLGR